MLEQRHLRYGWLEVLSICLKAERLSCGMMAIKSTGDGPVLSSLKYRV